MSKAYFMIHKNHKICVRRIEAVWLWQKTHVQYVHDEAIIHKNHKICVRRIEAVWLSQKTHVQYVHDESYLSQES